MTLKSNLHNNLELGVKPAGYRPSRPGYEDHCHRAAKLGEQQTCFSLLATLHRLHWGGHARECLQG